MGQHTETFVYGEASNLIPMYVSGVAHALLDGANVHISFYQEFIASDGCRERVIVQRIVMPMASLLIGRKIVDFEMAIEARQNASGQA